MKDENVAEYVSMNEYAARQGVLVIVFEFWRVSGELVRQCVPINDEYNVERLRGYEGWREVGSGKLYGFTGRLGRFGNQQWWIEWVREAPTPDFPFGWKWKLRRLTYRARVLHWTIQHHGIQEALDLLRRGYLKGKIEVMFVQE